MKKCIECVERDSWSRKGYCKQCLIRKEKLEREKIFQLFIGLTASSPFCKFRKKRVSGVEFQFKFGSGYAVYLFEYKEGEFITRKISNDNHFENLSPLIESFMKGLL